MTGVFQPPPTWAEVILVDERSGKGRFNPVWLKWFVDLTQVLNAAGGGTLTHNELAGLQGGSSNQMYHQTSSEYAYSQGIVAGTAAINCTTLTGSGLVKGAGLESTSTLVSNDTQLMKTNTNFANGAAAAAGTLLNAPAAGNPTKWIPVDDNGTLRYIPAW